MDKEKTEVKEKKWMGWLRPETKTGLGALVMMLASMLCVLLIASGDSFTKTSEPFAFAFGVAVGVAAGVTAVVAVGVAAGVVVGVTLGVMAGVVADVVAGVVAGVAAGVALGVMVGVSWDQKERKISAMPAILLYLIFLLPIFVTISPLSKYHNYRQIEKDQRITEVLQITVLEDGVKILLPDQYAKENSYLKKVFSLGWAGEENKKRWDEIVVPCREGKKHWFYARLPFPENKTETAHLELLLDHAWQDYTTTKEVSLK